MHHIAGGGEVEAGAPRPDRDEEGVDPAGLESLHLVAPLARRGAAGQPRQQKAALQQGLPDELEVRDELAEDEDRVALVAQGLHQLHHRPRLGAARGRLRIGQAGVAGRLAQAGQQREHPHAVLGFGALLGQREPREARRPDALVELPLLGVQRDRAPDVAAGRQIRGHLRLGAPQDEGRDQAGEAPSRSGVPALQGDQEARAECLPGRQQARQDDSEQGVQLACVVLHRGAGEGQPEARVEGPGGLVPARGRVLHGLGLVEDHGAPLHRGQRVDVPREQVPTGDEHVAGADKLQLLGPPGPAVLLAAEARGEPGGLAQPVPPHRRRTDDERRAVAPPQQQGQGLDRLAEPHVVGQHRAP